MNNRVVFLGNVHALATAVDTLGDQALAESGICVIHGAAGSGKTWALRHVARQSGALFSTALPFWTPHAMLTALARALDAAPHWRTATLFTQIEQALIATPRPIMIDELDRIADRPILLETLRILHDLTHVPLILAGMDETRRAIARGPQLRRRILHTIEFQPLSAADARTIAAERIQVALADDLIEELQRRSGGMVGLFCQTLAAAERYAHRRADARAATSSADRPGSSAPLVLALRDYRDRLGPAPQPARASRATALNAAAVAAATRRVA